MDKIHSHTESYNQPWYFGTAVKNGIFSGMRKGESLFRGVWIERKSSSLSKHYKEKWKKSIFERIAIFSFCIIIPLSYSFSEKMKKYICTECNFLYDPFSENEEGEPNGDFEFLGESWSCPHCGSDRDNFMQVPENIHDAPRSTEDASDEELRHTPFYFRQEDKLVVRVGNEDSLPFDPEWHFIEYVGVFDEYGENIDIIYRPDLEIVTFDYPDYEDFEVRAACNLHGTWRGIRIDG